MQPGQFLVNKKFSTRMKILGRSQDAIFTSTTQSSTESANHYWTEEELKEQGWSLLEEPWRPADFEIYYYLTDRGDVDEDRCLSNTRHYNFRFDTHNVFRNKEDAELYKQKLIERMGRKDN